MNTVFGDERFNLCPAASGRKHRDLADNLLRGHAFRIDNVISPLIIALDRKSVV